MLYLVRQLTVVVVTLMHPHTQTHTQVNMNTSHIYFSKNALSKLSGKTGLLKDSFFV